MRRFNLSQSLPLLLCFLVWGSTVEVVAAQGEGPRITYRYDNVPAVDCLQDLQDRYGLQFAYNVTALDGLRLSAQVSETELNSALEELLQSTGLRAELSSSQQILIVPIETAAAPVKERICGIVQDAETGERIGYANVFLPSQQLGAVTNDRGYFELAFLPEENAEVQFSFIGYENATRALDAYPRSGCPTIALAASENVIANVLVVDKAIQLMDTENGNDGYEMRPNQVATLPGWGEPDVLRTVQLMPGISSTNELASDLSIRGGTSDQNLILWQNIPVYHTGHFFGLQSIFNPSVVDRVEVHRSNLDAAYGGRVSGLLNIYSDLSLADSFHIDAGFNALSFNASTLIPLRGIRSTFLFSIRRSYTDWFETAVFRNFFSQVTGSGRIADIETNELVVEEFVTPQPNFFFRDQFFSWVTEFSPKTRLRLNSLNAEDALDYQVKTNNEFFFFQLNDKIEQENRGWNLALEHDWGPSTQSLFQLTGSRYSSSYQNLFNTDPNLDFRYRIDQENDLQHSQVKFLQTYAFSDRWRGYAGFELDEYDNTVSILRESSEQIDVNDSLLQANSVTSIYTHFEGELSDGIEVDLGIRGSAFKGFFFMEPRLQLNLRPTKRWYVKAGLSRTNQFIYQIELSNELDLAERYWLVAFRDILPVLKSLQTSVGIQYNYRSLLFEVEGYWRKLEDIPSEILPFPDNFNFIRSKGRSRHRGIDFLFKQRWPNLQLWAGYSISHSSYQFPTLNLTLPFSAFQDHRHNLQLTSIFELGSFELALSHRWRSGTPYTAVEGYEFMLNQQGNPFVSRVVFGRLNGSRLPDYSRTDFSAGWQFRSGRWEGKFGISVFNLTNRVNIGSYDYTIERNMGPDATTDPFEIFRIERDLMRRTWNFYFQGYF